MALSLAEVEAIFTETFREIAEPLLDKDAPLSEHNQQLCHILALAFVKIRAKETRRSSLWLGRLNRFMNNDHY
jgi:hypothetical protein